MLDAQKSRGLYLSQEAQSTLCIVSYIVGWLGLFKHSGLSPFGPPVRLHLTENREAGLYKHSPLQFNPRIVGINVFQLS